MLLLLLLCFSTLIVLPFSTWYACNIKTNKKEYTVRKYVAGVW